MMLFFDSALRKMTALFCAFLVLFGPTGLIMAQDEKDLSDLSIEELMNIEVTSVSRKKESLEHAPAAIYVITADDIRHSGATSIPELLRLVPGLEVAQVSADVWAVTARRAPSPPGQ